ncbi:peptidoglycan-binding protein [Streptosporangium sp. NPDC051023]|uniref:peptidoglycan-binding protein n=1 Tax=Streptosporangium sp. NPDC051023 TaxID=3155410 RepID=UPI00344C83A8
MRSPRRKLLIVLVGVLAIAGAGWVVSTRLRSPADEAAARTPPRPSLVTAPVERRKLVSAVVVAGTLEYGSPLPITLGGVIGGGETIQRVTRPPRPGTVKEGGLLLEVNGRPVFVFTGKVPMHRTLNPGAKGDDVRQLQKALRKLGHRAPLTGVFDPSTIAAVTAFYAKKGYEAQKPTLEVRQQLDTLRKAVQTAKETLVTEQKALDQGNDVRPLKLKVSNARQDLKVATSALATATSQEYTPEDDAKMEAAEAAVRAAEERLLEAEQALAQARRDNESVPAPAPAPAPSASGTPAPDTTPTPKVPTDTSLLELRVRNARAELETAQRAMDRLQEEAGQSREKRLTELRKAVRDAREALVVAEQALRQARQLSPVKLRVANAHLDLAAAQGLLAEFSRTYGTSVPPGEVVFLPKLPVRLRKVTIKAGEIADKAVATVTGSSFVVSGSVDSTEANLLKEGMKAVIETDSGKSFPATLTARGDKAKLTVGEEKQKKEEEGTLSSEPVLITPDSMKGLNGLSGAAVKARVTVGATSQEVLVVPVAAVITAADGRPRVQVEVAPDQTKQVEVRTGLTADGNVEVTGDLKEGDRVVVNYA